jgi:saccharopine dehydrogenase-like NADP-dependent oxidoreductase
LDGKKWRAISWTTAASLAAVVEMVADGKLPQQGFIKQEDIDFNAFLETTNGSYFKS